MNEDPMLKIWLMEYDKLKVEQIQRIGFRDNLLYTVGNLWGSGILCPVKFCQYLCLTGNPLGVSSAGLDVRGE